MAQTARKGYGRAMRKFSALFAFLTLSACQPPGPGVREFSSGTSQIVPGNSPTTVCMHTPEHDARWTPTEADLAILEPVLIELIEYRLDEDNLTYEDSSEMLPEQYHRNYYGIERSGSRYILVCASYGVSPVRVHDGGPSQFGALLDTRRRTFSWFEFGYRA